MAGVYPTDLLAPAIFALDNKCTDLNMTGPVIMLDASSET
jgi:hypothetical protein